MAKRVCPYWVGCLLLNPLRRLVHNPDKILAPHVSSGMTVLDIGSAMGFFTLPLARLVGPHGKVICVDVQERMLTTLQNRAQKAQLAERIVTRGCEPPSLGLADFYGRIDFALAFAVVHEVLDVSNFFIEVFKLLKTDARCLVAEPKGHVSAQDFEETLVSARHHGLTIVSNPKISWSRTALLRKE